MEEQALRDQAASVNDFRIIQEEEKVGVEPTPVSADSITLR